MRDVARIRFGGLRYGVPSLVDTGKLTKQLSHTPYEVIFNLVVL